MHEFYVSVFKEKKIFKISVNIKTTLVFKIIFKMWYLKKLWSKLLLCYYYIRLYEKKEIKTKYLCKNLGQNLGLHVTFIRFIGNQQGQSVF